MNTKPNDAAFARPVSDDGLISYFASDGLTKREYFAAQVIISFEYIKEVLKYNYPERNGNFSIDELLECQAKLKVRAADALIKELNEQI